MLKSTVLVVSWLVGFQGTRRHCYTVFAWIDAAPRFGGRHQIDAALSEERNKSSHPWINAAFNDIHNRQGCGDDTCKCKDMTRRTGNGHTVEKRTFDASFNLKVIGHTVCDSRLVSCSTLPKWWSGLATQDWWPMIPPAFCGIHTVLYMPSPRTMLANSMLRPLSLTCSHYKKCRQYARVRIPQKVAVLK